MEDQRTDPEVYYAEEKPATDLADYYAEEKPATDLDDYYTEEGPVIKKKSRKPLIIGIIIAAAVVIALAVTAAGALLPKNELKVKTAWDNTRDALVGRSELTSFASSLTKGESTGFDLKAEHIGQIFADSLSGMLPEFADYLSVLSLIDISGDLNAAVDRSGNVSALLDLSLFGNDLKAGYYCGPEGKGDIAVSFPILLKDKPLGASLEHIESDLDASVFAPDSGTQFAMSEDSFETLKTVLSSMKGLGKSAGKTDLSELDLKLISDVYTKLKLKKKKEQTEFDGNAVSCVVYSSEVDEEKAIAIVTAVKEWYGEDPEGRDGERSGSIGAIADDLLEKLPGSGFYAQAKFYVCKDYLAKTTLEGTMNGKAADLLLEFGPDPSVSNAIRVKLNLDGIDLSADIDLTKADSNEFGVSVISSHFNLDEDVSFRYDAAASSFELGMAKESAKVTGTMKLEPERMTIADPVISVKDGAFSLNLKGVSAEITKDAKIRPVSDDFPDGYSEILKMSESEIKSLIGTITGIFSMLSAFGS